MCFPCAVLAGMEPKRKNNNRSSAYDLGALNLEGLTFPMSLKQISRFEVSNPVSVNVFSFVDNVAVPAYVTSQRNKSFHVNLLFCSQRYYLVKSMPRLLRGLYHRKYQRKQYWSFLFVYVSFYREASGAFGGVQERRTDSKCLNLTLFSNLRNTGNASLCHSYCIATLKH